MGFLFKVSSVDFAFVCRDLVTRELLRLNIAYDTDTVGDVASHMFEQLGLRAAHFSLFLGGTRLARGYERIAAFGPRGSSSCCSLAFWVVLSGLSR